MADDLNLGAIKANDYRPDRNGAAAFRQSDLAAVDVPALVAEVERLRKELEAESHRALLLEADVLPRCERRAERAEAERDALKAALPGDVARQIAEVEAERAAMPEDERRRHEAADAPLLRLQLAGWYRQAKEAEAAIERVRVLHEDVDGQCDVCSNHDPSGLYDHVEPYPCPTLAALDHPTDTTGETETP